MCLPYLTKITETLPEFKIIVVIIVTVIAIIIIIITTRLIVSTII